jgi:ribonuclease P protein component
MAAQPEGSGASAPRMGFTASRKIGGAVARNRAKRRLRAAARSTMPGCALAGVDYVLVARSAVLTCDFSHLEGDLRSAMAELAKKWSASSSPLPVPE